MKRFFQTLIIIFFHLNPTINNAQNQDKFKSDWHFSYYMPYDNNLARFSEPIIKMIEENINTDKISVSVQLDDKQTEGSSRFFITSKGTQIEKTKDESSDNIETYTRYLNWVESKVDYKKHAVIFLDHGGKLNEVCLDEFPNNGFLTILEIKEAYKELYKSKIDLLFFQVCTKSVIEPLYEFKNMSKYTMASQLELGAPNYYYPEVFKYLSNNDNVSSEDLANKIMEYEALNMYSSYTLLNNKKFGHFARKLRQFIKKLNRKKINTLNDKPIKYSYYQEEYYDLVSVINNINLENDKRLRKRREKLVRYVKEKLIIKHKTNPYKPEMEMFSGLSISGENKTDYHNMTLYHLTTILREMIN
ncbi:MAG: hypothetical protein HRU50_04475 [Winogradskyella sp.]|uniref:clostripain-related cysteine peptidase n=1 Tax=Winogradskyella sp. TaxID=1883156 RepID=UPI0025DCE51F|nr:clostripain-related cysteine peptidase [Winogradskyella sp.]NRB59180.1 hypothetical protein [Winogradskyella sp.]